MSLVMSATGWRKDFAISSKRGPRQFRVGAALAKPAGPRAWSADTPCQSRPPVARRGRESGPGKTHRPPPGIAGATARFRWLDPPSARKWRASARLNLFPRKKIFFGGFPGIAGADRPGQVAQRLFGRWPPQYLKHHGGGEISMKTRVRPVGRPLVPVPRTIRPDTPSGAPEPEKEAPRKHILALPYRSLQVFRVCSNSSSSCDDRSKTGARKTT